MPRLIIQPIGLRVVVDKGETIFEAVKRGGLSLPSICGGLGLCGKCVVRVLSGNVSPPSKQELKLLGRRLKNSFRLACQTTILRDVEIEIPRESLTPAPKVAVEGLETPVPLNQAVKEVTVEVEKPDLSDLRSDYRRLIDSLKRYVDVEHFPTPSVEVLRRIPSALRSGGWSSRVIYHVDLGVLDVYPSNESRGLYGLALDIGTTKLAAYLVNLRTGETEAIRSMLNPQIRYGEDVISRITYASDLKKTLRLQEAVVEGVNRLIDDACRDVGIANQDIYEVLAVGNTAMHHLLLGITPKTLGLAPFTPILQDPVNVEASRIGLRVNESANLHLLPVIAGFVGSDAVADVIATGIYMVEKPSMVIDVGTNTEIILNNGENIYACSCASGPAFEGARIKHGMRASEGAIERVSIDHDGVSYKVIGDVKPIGICGSGVVDALATLLDAGLLHRNGRFDVLKSPSMFIKSDREYEFVLVKREETGTGEALTITQRDVREVQLAKAAIATGVKVLMEEGEVDLGDLSCIYLAGSFGTYINPESAIRIGLLPKVKLDQIKPVGNAAGVGARLCLISHDERVRAWAIAKRMRFVEFYVKKGFRKVFLENLGFPEA